MLPLIFMMEENVFATDFVVPALPSSVSAKENLNHINGKHGWLQKQAVKNLITVR